MKNIPLFGGVFQKKYDTLLARDIKKLRKNASTSRKTFDSIVFLLFFDIGELQKSFDKITKFIINGKLKKQNNLQGYMDYKARAKSRKLKRKVTKFLNVLKFNSMNATSYHKIILLGCLIVLSGLLFTWVEVVGIQGIGKENGFSALLGASGWIILILTLFIIFVLLSERTKEKLKLLFNISFKDYHPPIVGGAIMMLMIINSIVTMRALRTFSSEIVFGRGLFIAVSGTIIVILGGLSLKKHYDKNVKGIYSEIGDDGQDIIIETKDNMKLPF